MEIRMIKEYSVRCDDGFTAFFGSRTQAAAFISIVEKLKLYYAIHAGDIKQEDKNLNFKKGYGPDSTDYVTVHNCHFTPIEIKVARQFRQHVMAAASEIDDFSLTQHGAFFECHCPSEG